MKFDWDPTSSIINLWNDIAEQRRNYSSARNETSFLLNEFFSPHSFNTRRDWENWCEWFLLKYHPQEPQDCVESWGNLRKLVKPHSLGVVGKERDHKRAISLFLWPARYRREYVKKKAEKQKTENGNRNTNKRPRPLTWRHFYWKVILNENALSSSNNI